jgi:hypothetical protein
MPSLTSRICWDVCSLSRQFLSQTVQFFSSVQSAASETIQGKAVQFSIIGLEPRDPKLCLCQADMFTRKIELEKRRVAELDKQIQQMNTKVRAR